MHGQGQKSEPFRSINYVINDYVSLYALWYRFHARETINMAFLPEFYILIKYVFLTNQSAQVRWYHKLVLTENAVDFMMLPAEMKRESDIKERNIKKH